MSDLDPVTGRPVTAPIPPATTPGGVGSTTTGGGGQYSGGQSGGDAKAKAAEAADQAREKAAAAGGAVTEHAGQVTESAKAHAAEVTDEARRQAAHLVEEGRSQLRSTASQQTDRAAEFLQGIGDQLNAMARGEKAPEGPLADLVQEGAARVEHLASRLRTGGYEMALRDVQSFARRRPGMFLASAFGAGLLAGRLVKNTDTSQLTQSGSGQGGQGSQGSQYSEYGQYRGGSNVTQAEMELSRGGVPAPMTTGAASAGLPGAPAMPDADPLVTGDPTGVQGGPR